MSSYHSHIRPLLLRVTRIHLIFVVIYIAQIIAFDAGKLITPNAVLWRWIAIGALLSIATLAWVKSHNNNLTDSQYRKLVYLLTLTDIAFASFNIYTQRGMSSRAVILYILALGTIATLRTRASLYATAIFASIAYVATTVAYFVLNFNEGYKIELYGEVLFYAATIIIYAAIIWSLIRPKR